MTFDDNGGPPARRWPRTITVLLTDRVQSDGK